jgi:hypothetical protein
MRRQANAVDFWRGFALVSIFINHIPGIYYEKFTHRNVSISDSAELFVFLAGWSLGLLVMRSADAASTSRIILRLGGRAVQIYAAQILISSIAIAILATASLLLDNPLLLDWHNASAVFQDPVGAHIGLVLLTHQLGYFDILPLYVVLMLSAPAIAVIDRFAPRWLLPVSLAIYFATLVVPITVSSWPVPGQWFFNPFAWQLIFVLGYVLSKEDGLGGLVRRHIKWIRIVSAPIVVIGVVLVWFNWMPDPTKMPEPRLLFVHSKSFETPIRVLQFLALIAVFSAAYPYISAAVPSLVEYLSSLGRNSLYVFCVGSLLSLTAQIVRYIYSGSILVDTLIVIAGLILLRLTAWVSERRETLRARE